MSISDRDSEPRGNELKTLRSRKNNLTAFAPRVLSACERIHFKIENVTVAIWLVDLRLCSASIGSFLEPLSTDELSRAERFSAMRDRSRYLISHGALRMILSDYTNVDPKHLKFVIGRHGKPSLDRTRSLPDVRFNLSHSANMAVIAVAPGHEVGVDIEYIKAWRVSFSDVENCFSRGEIAALQSLPKVDQELAFFTCWTRKEAYLKGRGEGLSLPLCDFDVSLAPGEAAALLGSRINPRDCDRWRLFEVPVGDGYVANAAVQLPLPTGVRFRTLVPA